MKKNLLLLLGVLSTPLFSQQWQEQSLPLKRVILFSSGVAYFEHGGNISGDAEIILPFALTEINDALKSITINDPVSKFPAVQYPSEQTLSKTLHSLKIDLSGNPSIADILGSLRGTEIKVFAPGEITGKIIGVEERPSLVVSAKPGLEHRNEAYVSLLSAGSIRTIAVRDISSFAFTDPKINDDLNRALDLIIRSRDSNSRNLQVQLPGSGSRNTVISYVIPSPVWKVSYRLDLSPAKPVIQGWAIIDNDGDRDWTNVELSLVSGRPVSFIQNLYQPYHLSRPVLPLAIAGYAQAETYDSGWGGAFPEESMRKMAEVDEEMDYSRTKEYEMSAAKQMAMAPSPAPNVSSGTVAAAQAQAAGDHFAYTISKPVSLARQQSTMVPLVDTTISAVKSLIFSGAKAASGMTINPGIAAELSNNTGMKLPAGPITVYDAGNYAGDALIEFFPDGAKRYISYGEDLSVTGTMTQSSSSYFSSVQISKGIMTISRKLVYEKKYTFVNNSGEEKRLIIEHPFINGAALIEPAQFDERTDSLYRFITKLPKTGNLSFAVKEESPISERVSLSQARPETLLAYISSGEMPANMKTVLQKAMELKQQADNAKTALANIESEKTRKITEQDRIRKNLEAVGPQSSQGQEYLKRMTAIDTEIDNLDRQAVTARFSAQNTQKAYEDYLASISL